MERPDLARSLRAIADLPVGRAAIDGWSAERGPAGFADDLEAVFAGITLGLSMHRAAGIVIASWLAHLLASDDASVLAELGDIAEAGSGRPLVRRVFGDPRPRSSILPRARLADGNRAVYADISGIPTWLRGDRANAAYDRSPPSRRFMVRNLRESVCLHHDPIFIGRLLDQPWARAVDAVAITARRPTTPAIVLAVATRDRWFREANVRRAIAENPFTPRPIYEVLRLARRE